MYKLYRICGQAQFILLLTWRRKTQYLYGAFQPYFLARYFLTAKLLSRVTEQLVMNLDQKTVIVVVMKQTFLCQIDPWLVAIFCKSIKNYYQIVYLTFDGAFTSLAEEQFYNQLFNGYYTNPNECSIRATHFITQSYTDYSLVNRYWHLGHEMASNSIRYRICSVLKILDCFSVIEVTKTIGKIWMQKPGKMKWLE